MITINTDEQLEQWVKTNVEGVVLPNTDDLEPAEWLGIAPLSPEPPSPYTHPDELEARTGDLIEVAGAPVPMIFLHWLPSCMIVMLLNEMVSVRASKVRILSDVESAKDPGT